MAYEQARLGRRPGDLEIDPAEASPLSPVCERCGNYLDLEKWYEDGLLNCYCWICGGRWVEERGRRLSTEDTD